MDQKQVLKRYYREFTFSMSAYVVILILATSLLERLDLSRPLQVILAVIPIIPVVFVIVSLLRLLMDSDELQQRVNLLATTFSAVMTGLLTFSYGFLENIGFPKLSTFAVFPMLFALWGIGVGYFTRRYK